MGMGLIFLAHFLLSFGLCPFLTFGPAHLSFFPYPPPSLQLFNIIIFTYLILFNNLINYLILFYLITLNHYYFN